MHWENAALTLRHAGDAARLREVLQPERSVVIVGAGTIGLELAASATQRRCKVTVIELAATVMGRNAPPPVQRYLLQRHQQAGVRILLNNAIEHVVDGEKVELTLQSGEDASGRCGDLRYWYQRQRPTGSRGQP